MIISYRDVTEYYMRLVVSIVSHSSQSMQALVGFSYVFCVTDSSSPLIKEIDSRVVQYPAPSSRLFLVLRSSRRVRANA